MTFIRVDVIISFNEKGILYGKVNNINIHDYYKEVLKGKDLTVPAIRSWKLIKDSNQYRTSNTAISEDGKIYLMMKCLTIGIP